jgi:hypothetical protein
MVPEFFFDLRQRAVTSLRSAQQTITTRILVMVVGTVAMAIKIRLCMDMPTQESARSRHVSPNKHMQRAGTHKVLGRGRSGLVLSQVPLARVLMPRRAGADVNGWAHAS